MDDFEILSSAALYNDTIKVEGTGKAVVKAVTNTCTGESVVIENGGTVTVNDYFGTAYTITTEDLVLGITYNGKDVPYVVNNNDYTFKIAPSEITSDGSLIVKTEKSDKVVVFYDDADDRGAQWSAFRNYGVLSFE